MTRPAVLPAAVLPRAPRRMRILVLLSLVAAGAAILLLRTLEPAAPRERSVEAPRPAAAAAPAAPTAPAEAKGPALHVSVRDAEDLPLAGARCDVDPWGASATTDDLGLASIPVSAGARADVTVRASKEGYRPASRRGRLVEGQTMKLKLLRAPEIRVFDGSGERVALFSLEPPGADLHARKLRAKGYLPVDLGDLPRGLLSAWDDLLGRTPLDLHLVSDDGLGRAVLRVEHPAGAPVAVTVDRTRARLPALGARLRTLPPGWRSFYAERWNSPRDAGVIAKGEEMKVYAEGTIVVTCLATDCRPLRQEIDVAPGKPVERTLALVAETWAIQEIVAEDRFGREGPWSVELLEPLRFPLPAQGSAVRVPRGGGPYVLRADGGARGRAVLRVDTLPSKEPIRFEFSGVEVRLRLLDDESGDPIEGLALRLDGEGPPVEWRPEEGVYVFGPVDPGTVRVLHDAGRTVDVRVDPSEAERGVVRREARVRGFPQGGSSEPE